MGRRGRKEKAEPFAEANTGIDNLERAMIGRMVRIPFKPDHVARWLWPAEIVDKLKAAFPFVRDNDRSTMTTVAVPLQLLSPATTVSCYFNMQMTRAALHMLVPERGLAKPDPAMPMAQEIVTATADAYEQHLRFEIVRKVVRWLNETPATVGAARHYCPWLGSLLPAGHAYHMVSGHGFRQPQQPMTSILDDMRQCAVIIAGAALAGPPKPGTGTVAVAFSGIRRHTWLSTVTNQYQSQAFSLTSTD